MFRMNMAVDKLLELGVDTPSSLAYEKTLGVVALGKIDNDYVMVTVADDKIGVTTGIANYEYARGGSIVIIFRTREVIVLGRGRNYHSYIKLIPVDSGGYVYKSKNGHRYALPNFDKGREVEYYEV